jgi:hypothetical protein
MLYYPMRPTLCDYGPESISMIITKPQIYDAETKEYAAPGQVRHALVAVDSVASKFGGKCLRTQKGRWTTTGADIRG